MLGQEKLSEANISDQEDSWLPLLLGSPHLSSLQVLQTVLCVVTNAITVNAAPVRPFLHWKGLLTLLVLKIHPNVQHTFYTLSSVPPFSTPYVSNISAHHWPMTNGILYYSSGLSLFSSSVLSWLFWEPQSSLYSWGSPTFQQYFVCIVYVTGISFIGFIHFPPPVHSSPPIIIPPEFKNA